MELIGNRVFSYGLGHNGTANGYDPECDDVHKVSTRDMEEMMNFPKFDW